MKMIFPRICRLIDEQRLIHNVSDLYMYLQQLYFYNREGLLKPAAGGFFFKESWDSFAKMCLQNV